MLGLLNLLVQVAQRHAELLILFLKENIYIVLKRSECHRSRKPSRQTSQAAQPARVEPVRHRGGARWRLQSSAQGTGPKEPSLRFPAPGCAHRSSGARWSIASGVGGGRTFAPPWRILALQSAMTRPPLAGDVTSEPAHTVALAQLSLLTQHYPSPCPTQPNAHICRDEALSGSCRGPRHVKVRAPPQGIEHVDPTKDWPQSNA